jgi:fibronectin-binding autotransporter adhesin
MFRLRTIIPLLTGSAALLCASAQAQTTYLWANSQDDTFWSSPFAWIGNVAPSGTNVTDILQFGGDGSLGTYTSTNDRNDVPVANTFVFNKLLFTGTNTASSFNILNGKSFRLTGTSPQITQNGTIGFGIENDLRFLGNLLTINGTGNGTIALRGALSGIGNIVKSGPANLEFGSKTGAADAASENTWMGTLTLQGGNVRMDGNRPAAGALRANPIIFTSNSTLSFNRSDIATIPASLRFGNISGSVGTIQATVQAGTLDNYNVVITALGTTTFGGTLIGPVPSVSTNDPGDFVVRGPGSQTFTGLISTNKDVIVGKGATLRLAGTASLSSQLQGAITMSGGTFILDNTNGNIGTGRLRDADPNSTGLETIGGGVFRLIGADSGTTETMGRLQLGSFLSGSPGETRRRSGQLSIEVIQRSLTGNTDLNFQNYSRDEQNLKQYATVDFVAKDASGNLLTLGNAANGPHIRLATPSVAAPTYNGLLTITAGASTNSVGWATVNGTDFASYDANYGVIPVASTLSVTGSTPSNTANVRVEQSVTSPTAYTVNSIKMAPTIAAQSLSVTGALSSTAFLLTGAIDFAINATSISGGSTRFFYIQQAALTVNAPLNGAAFSVVKSGEGTMILTNTTNNSLFGPAVHTSINGGILRATPGTTLPSAELRIRGGQLEIANAGPITKSLILGTGTGSINWTNISGGGDIVDEDQGSGGISAFGGDVTFSLTYPTTIPAHSAVVTWEEPGFVQSNFELVFGSSASNAKVIWKTPISLTELGATAPAYAARTIRVLDNPAVATDWTQLNAVISGTKQNDLIKTGPGQLEFNVVNTYTGATIIQDGTLLVNAPGDNKASFLHDVLAGATLGGNGTVGAVRVNSGGKLAPGSGPLQTQALNIVGDLSFVDGTSQLVLELGGTNTASATAGYDRLNVTGTVNLNGGSLVASFTNGYTGGPDVLFLILNDGVDAVQGQFAQGSIFQTTSGQSYAISYTAEFGNAQFTGVGNDVAIMLVPEPSSALLLGLGTLLVARRRRGK